MVLSCRIQYKFLYDLIFLIPIHLAQSNFRKWKGDCKQKSLRSRVGRRSQTMIGISSLRHPLFYALILCSQPINIPRVQKKKRFTGVTITLFSSELFAPHWNHIRGTAALQILLLNPFFVVKFDKVTFYSTLIYGGMNHAWGNELWAVFSGFGNLQLGSFCQRMRRAGNDDVYQREFFNLAVGCRGGNTGKNKR